jgi:prepilin-type N-terminal cleavage/methylation domain-containing protein
MTTPPTLPLCPRRRRGRGLTLVELLVALAVVAVTSTAVVAMIQGAARVNTAINAGMTAGWDVEAALLRMTQQLRLATAVSVPTGTSAGTAFSLTTQPDAANNNATYAVTYALVTAADGSQQLQETDPRYGTSVLIRNVQSFSVKYRSTTAPLTVSIAVTAGTGPGTAITRRIHVTPRNQ